MDRDSSLAKRDSMVLAAVSLLYIVYIGVRTVYPYNNFNSAFDAAVFNSSFWNTVHGNGLFYNSLEGGSHFGVHFSPIMFLLLPLYWIVPDFRVLLLSETLWMAAGIPAVFMIARHLLSRNASLVIAFLYAASPLVHGVNLVNGEGFHPIAFSTTALLYAIWFFQRSRKKLFWLALVVALCCREDVALVVVFFGIYLWVIHRRAALGIAVILVSALWFGATLGFVVPWFRGEAYSLATPGLAYLGDAVPEIITNFFRRPGLVLERVFAIAKLKYLLGLLAPLFFLPVFSPWHLLPCAPTLLVNLSSEYFPNFVVAERYTSTILPFLFLATILGVKNLSRMVGSHLGPPEGRKVAWSFLILALLISVVGSTRSTIRFVKSTEAQNRVYGESGLAARQALDEVSRLIPADSSVSFSSHRGMARFSYRKELKVISDSTLNRDIVIIDGARPHVSTTTWSEIEQFEEKLRRDKGYSLLFNRAGIRMYSRESLPSK
jgi:uncharacterized membrane protein